MPTPTKYTYSIANDFPNGAVAPAKLKREISASSIVTALDRIDTAGDVCDVWFKDPLSAGDKTTLDNDTTAPSGGLIGAHDGVAVTLVPEEVVIQEEEIKTGGHFQSHGYKDNIPATSGWYDMPDITWPYPITLLAAEAKAMSANDGDHIEFVVGPDVTVGSISSDVTASDTVINVSQSVLDNVAVGKFICLDDGTNVDDCGRVTAVDKTAGTITVETATANGFAAATPTLVKMTTKMAVNIELSSDHRIALGESKIGGSYVPANTVLRMRYYNQNGSAKSFKFYLEYLY